MSMSLPNHSVPEHIEFELTPEQTEVLVRTAARGRCPPELEPLPIEILSDSPPSPLHQAMSPEGEAFPFLAPNVKWSDGEPLWLPEPKVTPPVRETMVLQSDATPIPTSQERSLGSSQQSSKPLHTGRVGLVVRGLLYVGLLVGITYVRQIGEEPIQVAQKLDSNPALVGDERAPAAPSSDSEPVRIKNPFDRTEVFEFPAGTGEAEAREAVTKLLMERAHDRLPLLAEASRRRGPTEKHETHESSQMQDGQFRNSQEVPRRGPG
jgi:hypothetical protein